MVKELLDSVFPEFPLKNLIGLGFSKYMITSRLHSLIVSCGELAESIFIHFFACVSHKKPDSKQNGIIHQTYYSTN